ncbi:MAG TPA: SDR family oxidoreductase [Steroidobacteraceae bacterium]|jgi:3-oxoacyl-[acyl-carrier protein] reductase
MPVALVTGATGGLGAAIARALAVAGFNVAVGYHRSAEAAARLAGDLTGEGHFCVPASVTDSAALRRTAVQIEERCGRCDVLVNCAGTTRFVAHADLTGLDDALFDAIFAVNVRGAFAGVRALEEMLARSDLPGGGVIVNISSIAAVTAMGSNIAYCASKAALDNMTRSLARALAPRIRVLSISPGLVDTDFIKSLEPAWRDEQAARTPLRRLAQPAEVARAVVAAVTQLTFTTGSIIAVDGGRPLA